MAWRRNLLAKCAKDPLFRERTKELFFRDPLFAFNAFFFTYDVRKRPLHQQPFCTYDYQDDLILELIDYINKGEDFGAFKTRDMGLSWSVICVFLWFWLNPGGGADFLCGSRVKDYVDGKGDMRTLFEKIRYALYRLPKWLRPKGFRRILHDNFARLQNPETGASITGESNNPNFSTGGRYAAILFDEFAKWELTDESAWTAAGDATPCRIPISTAFGAGGHFYNLVTDGKTRMMVLPWTLHPEKTRGIYCAWPPPNLRDREGLLDWKPEVELRSPWYDHEDERRSSTEMAQEVNMDFLGSGNPVFEGRAAQSLKYYRMLRVEPETWFDPSEGKEVSKPRDHEGYLVVYQRPKREHTYVICADVAEGKIEGDWSVVKVYNRETGSVDASYYSKVDENELAYVLKFAQDLYKDEKEGQWPWTTPETNACGIATFNKCVDIGVRNLFMMPKYDVSKAQVTYRKGWVTNGPSRKMIVSGLKECLVDRTAGFIDPRCIGELGTFVKNKVGKPMAKGGCYDDEVLCLGICIQVDQLAPYTGKVPRYAVVSQEAIGAEGIREAAFVERPTEKPPTLEEECLACAIAKQAERTQPREEAFESAIDAMFGFGEDDDYY